MPYKLLLNPKTVCPKPKTSEHRSPTGNIFQKLEKVQGALEMCQKALNEFMALWQKQKGFYKCLGLGYVCGLWGLGFRV